MFDQKKFTMDWLQFIEQVKERVNRDDLDEFEYQLKSQFISGKKVTFSIKVITEDKEDNLLIFYPVKKKEGIA